MLWKTVEPNWSLRGTVTMCFMKTSLITRIYLNAVSVVSVTGPNISAGTHSNLVPTMKDFNSAKLSYIPLFLQHMDHRLPHMFLRHFAFTATTHTVLSGQMFSLLQCGQHWPDCCSFRPIYRFSVWRVGLENTSLLSKPLSPICSRESQPFIRSVPRWREWQQIAAMLASFILLYIAFAEWFLKCFFSEFVHFLKTPMIKSLLCASRSALIWEAWVSSVLFVSNDTDSTRLCLTLSIASPLGMVQVLAVPLVPAHRLASHVIVRQVVVSKNWQHCRVWLRLDEQIQVQLFEEPVTFRKLFHWLSVWIALWDYNDLSGL